MRSLFILWKVVQDKTAYPCEEQSLIWYGCGKFSFVSVKFPRHFIKYKDPENYIGSENITVMGNVLVL